MQATGEMNGRPPENTGEVAINLPVSQVYDAAPFYSVSNVQHIYLVGLRVLSRERKEECP